MMFSSKWLDWDKDTEREPQTQENDSVDTVSALNVHIDKKTVSYNKKSSFLSTPRSQKSEIFSDIRIQRTDATDTNKFLDGHQVSKIVWQTNNATIFTDEHGHFWRWLESYGQAWPVIVKGGK